MSVINKMLRDLDARHASSAGMPRTAGVRVVLDADGTLGYGRALPGLRSRNRWAWIAGVLLVAVLGAAAWYFTQAPGVGAHLRAATSTPVNAAAGAPSPAAVASAADTMASTVAQAPGAAVSSAQSVQTAQATAATTTTPASPKLPVQAAVSTPVLANKVESSPPAPKAQAPVAAPAPASKAPPPSASAKPLVSTASAALSAPMATQSQLAPSQSPSQMPAATVAAKAPLAVANPAPVNAKPAGAASTAVDASVIPRVSSDASSKTLRQTAVQETLRQAQELWRSGAHEAALELMREAVAVAERAQHDGTLAGGIPVLASLVRELARMELAQGRVSQVRSLLIRLEPDLADQADLWALRGNAAQRLGRHEESVDAYFKALALRADEPRWLLGAAVSLAALGRLEAAAEQAEKARAAGAVNPEILGYLRQAGVPIK